MAFTILLASTYTLSSTKSSRPSLSKSKDYFFRISCSICLIRAVWRYLEISFLISWGKAVHCVLNRDTC
jgi:hypothetical protein